MMQFWFKVGSDDVPPWKAEIARAAGRWIGHKKDSAIGNELKLAIRKRIESAGGLPPDIGHWITIDGNHILINDSTGNGSSGKRVPPSKPYSKLYPHWAYDFKEQRFIAYCIAPPRPIGYNGPKIWYSPDFLPPSTAQALQRALNDEGLPGASDYRNMAFIAMQESHGQPGVLVQPKPGQLQGTARGLFQLISNSAIKFNPNGLASIGNAYEESIGTIRYMKVRYNDTDTAVDDWKKKGNW